MTTMMKKKWKKTRYPTGWQQLYSVLTCLATPYSFVREDTRTRRSYASIRSGAVGTSS